MIGGRDLNCVGSNPFLGKEKLAWCSETFCSYKLQSGSHSGTLGSKHAEMPESRAPFPHCCEQNRDEHGCAKVSVIKTRALWVSLGMFSWVI